MKQSFWSPQRRGIAAAVALFVFGSAVSALRFASSNGASDATFFMSYLSLIAALAIVYTLVCRAFRPVTDTVEATVRDR